MKILHVNNMNSVNEYNKMIKSKPCMVLYYMTKCGHCIALEPEWNKLENIMKNKNNNNVFLAKVNSNYLPYVESTKDILGFPSILYLHKNGEKKTEFQEKREYKYLIEFMNNILKENSSQENSFQKGGLRKNMKKTKRKINKKYMKKRIVNKITNKRKSNKKRINNRNKKTRKYNK
jgi:thioredoxin-like negative regulator of GroEL